jgi:hypothetical protein
VAISSFKRAGLSRVTRPQPAVISGAATGSFASGGKTYNFYRFNANGSLTVLQEGWASLFLLAGGGGSWDSGAGAGGLIEDDVYLTSGTYTITVGAGGAAAGANGSDSKFGRGTNTTIYAVGGGRGVVAWGNGIAGGCGGGASSNVAGASLYEQGNRGGQGPVNGTYSGGGGQGSAGPDNSGNGGAGISSTFTGTAVSRAAGGRGVSGSADGTFWTGAANSGDGGRYISSANTAGHSGVVIVKVEV